MKQQHKNKKTTPPPGGELINGPGYTRVYPGIPGYIRVYPGIPGYTRVYLGIPGYTLVYPGIPGYTRVSWRRSHGQGMDNAHGHANPHKRALYEPFTSPLRPRSGAHLARQSGNTNPDNRT